ncbi:hypothetical protein CDG77_28900 [Nostoc sp. 'Peltigera membranacea cyanobiont' 213]|uniref:hypothetical protein n=1 Tax=Nostoc sp. 'Peltigera membranacea cyanobiont' 213 TaxID=2014530 RepID=UPI000B955B15|nr:hypothetical protein [Nostoc sp. 'Peltigera membranacea cyanobiont' 213]OYD87530.1 hypothetical protein CDG77_28900 [Nostoc sp. 'Peltigera membranacea cyanobiont' 213]
MSKYHEYETSLHRIILYSADVLPEQVETYLSELAKSENDETKEEVISKIQDFKPLVDSIPRGFVDFVISVLIQKPVKPKNHPHIRRRITSSLENRNFGINDILNFIPPAPIQGPFFFLLLNHEDEGLRLVHALTNAASEKWRKYKQRQEIDQPKLTPLPVTINLPSGYREFWGDTQVYCWFRGTTDGPYTVISALMALEEWMERQIEAGRDVEALFEKVLSESNSVAVLGICLSMALAYPEKCLKVLLPIVSCPDIWEMDISRLAYDSTNSWDGLKEWEWDESKKLYYEVLERRNKRPQRSREIRGLAMYYVLSSDDFLRVAFEQAVEKFTENLPFRYQQEKTDPNAVAALRDKMENYQVFGRRENYQQQQVGEHWHIWVERPEEIRKRNEELLKANVELERWLGVYLWAKETIKNGKAQERMTLEETVSAAKELQTSEDFAEMEQEDIHASVTRLKAIVGVAAAILIADFEWSRTQNHLEWSRAILLAAARMPKASMYAMSPSSVKVYAGRGLALLATHGVADTEVRQQILQLISESLRRISDAGEVVKAVFGGLANAWNVDPVLCWNALSLCLSLSVIPGQLYYGTRVGQFETSFEELETWEDNVIQNHFDYLAKDEIPEFPRIPTAKNIVFVHEKTKYGVYALPLTELCRDSNTKDKLIQLCDDLVARTIVDNLPVEDKGYSQSHKPYMWNHFIFDWAAYLAQSISVEETRQHILTPLRDNWSQIPELTADLLNGYISHQIAYVEGPTAQALETWKEICNWVLDSPEIARSTSYDYLDRDTGKVLQLIIFTQHGSSRIKDDWQHAHLFIDIFDKWVSVAGHTPYAYSHLFTMLNGIGRQFAPEPTLEWLNRCSNNAVHDLWSEQRGNGRRTAELLNRIWNGFEQQIRNDKAILQRYSNLVYQLLEAGIPLASILRQKLEGRGSSA